MTPTPSPTPTPVPISSIQWDGHTWQVTDYLGGVFSNNNVWVDSSNWLHMKLIYDGSWHNFNLIQSDGVGYGTYKWTVRTNVSSIMDSQNGGDPNFLFTPFLYDSSNNNEIDIQMSKIGNAHWAYNTNWTIRSPIVNTQSNHFVGSYNKWTLEWMPDHIKFSVQGPSQPYKEWVFTNVSQIPTDTSFMKSLLTIGQSNNAAPPNNMSNYSAEIVLSSYSYTPYTPVTSPTPTPTATPTPSPTATPTPVSTITWSGHTWQVTDYTSHVFTNNNVWVDSVVSFT